MKSKRYYATAAYMVLFLFLSASYAKSDDVYWHIDPSVKSCSMVMDASLTQDQWHRFAEQAGTIVTFKSLASAKTLGKGNIKIAIDNAFTPIDQKDLAWINTFTHPDEDCPLGDQISFPTIRASIGVTEKLDVGGYWTTAPEANYGMIGAELKYAFLQESGKFPAAAVRTSASLLTGVSDFDMNIFSVDVIASKTYSRFTPYLGVRGNYIIGTETTSKVNLDKEMISVTQGFAGVTYAIWMLDLAAEYDISNVNTFAFALGFNL